jgi:hypothetical protein
MRQTILILFLIATTSASLGQGVFGEYEYISPRPGSGNHNPEATIIFRVGERVDASTIERSAIRVTGLASGAIEGTLVLSTDGETVVFKPRAPFRYGERVRVELGNELRTATGREFPSYEFYFAITEEAAHSRRQERPTTSSAFGATPAQRSSVNPIPYPIVDVNDNPAPGSVLYLNPNSSVPPRSGEYSGWALFFASDGSVRKQRDLGAARGELTMHPDGLISWGEPVAGPSLRGGIPVEWIVADTTFAPVDTLQCGNGYVAEKHEVRLLPNGHALLTSYVPMSVNMADSIAGGEPNATVEMDVIQELDAEGNVVFQWRGWDWLPIVGLHDRTTESQFPHLHLNAVEVDRDGNLLLSCRTPSSIIKIHRRTGEVLWIMGGMMNEWNFVGENETWAPYYMQTQHDIRVLPNGNYTYFDNGDRDRREWARGVEYAIDEANKTATLVWQYAHPDSFNAPAAGSMQRLPNGNSFICWGWSTITDDAAITEVTPDNRVVWEVRFPGDVFPYRVRKHAVYDNKPVYQTSARLGIGDSVSLGEGAGVRVALSDAATGDSTTAGIVREDYAPLLPVFQGDAPRVAPYRVFLSASVGDSARYRTTIDLKRFPKAAVSNHVGVFRRDTPNDGMFEQLPADYDEANHTITFFTHATGAAAEFIVADTAELPAVVEVEDERNDPPTSYSLERNYPNPFNPTTTIEFSLPEATTARVAIYDMLGREVAVLADGRMTAGAHSVEFDASALSSGVYFYRLEAGSFNAVKKMALMK